MNPYGGNPNQPYPYAQTPPSDHEVMTWLDNLARQQHGWDPRIYSDPRPPAQYPSYHQQPQPVQHMQHPQQQPLNAQNVQYAQYPQYPQYTSTQYAAQNQANAFPHTFQQGSSSTPRHMPVYSPQPQPSSYGHSEGDDASSTTSSPTDPDSPRGRSKPTIALDPLQPLTVDGKPRERVYVACDRCRVRKLRCDGAKPSCYQCQRAAEAQGVQVQCHYDPVPKRRGQDKAPRTRSAIGVRQPRKPAVRKNSQEGQSQYRS